MVVEAIRIKYRRMDASQVLNAVVDSDSEIDWNESSPECSSDEEDEVENLLDPLSAAEVGFTLFY